MLASLALVGASVTAASADGQAGADQLGQQPRGAHGRLDPPSDDVNKCGNGTATQPSGTSGDSQTAIVCGANGPVIIHNEQGITPGLATAILGGIGGIIGGGGGG
ncbi:hypothetical protein [Streptomyces avermitilis]|uniref:hypothetical protein n=1 Tax=Streptomyces avermitilis TaxID=33903 RepID=UPI0038048480